MQARGRLPCLGPVFLSLSIPTAWDLYMVSQLDLCIPGGRGWGCSDMAWNDGSQNLYGILVDEFSDHEKPQSVQAVLQPHLV